MLYTDPLHRIAYATDASIYSEMPMAVAYPETEDDLRQLLAEARSRHTHLIPRAAGTSIAGQVVGSGIVVDVSRKMNRILQLNTAERWVRVQPGVVRDELNHYLRPHGLFFSPETSTSNRCCIGGMVGNNSCGTHSLIYGSTRHHVLGIRLMLADGSTLECRTDSVPATDSPLANQIVQLLLSWQQDKVLRQTILDAFPDPSLRRRSCGYALDECLYTNSGVLNLPALICGSEGTLCMVTEITLALDPLPSPHQMVLCEMLPAMDDAWQANLQALKREPVAVELIDGKILQLAKDNIGARRNMEVLHLDVEHLPAAVLVSEYRAESTEELQSTALRVTQDSPYPTVCLFNQDVQKIWNLRKAGLGVLSGVEGDAKPIGVIEDTAVAPERMADYMHDFEQMMQRLQLDCVYYGHISTGELHLRPILDIKRSDHRRLFREVATETAQLVRLHHGSLSGEHGDGRLRGEFIPLMYGEQVYQLFRQLKQTFDPDGLFNMGKIVDTPPMDAFMRYDVNQTYALSHRLPKADVVSLMQRIERCNGAGDCRKSNLMGGTMCPTFKQSGDELLATRARANVLRYLLTHEDDALRSPILKQVLDSCLACKGCRSECPSNVDMTRLRSEVLQLSYDASHTPLRTWLVSHMAMIERWGSLVPRIYNFFATNRYSSLLLKHVVQFAAERQIPRLSQHTMRYLVNRQVHHYRHKVVPKGKVYLFADEFTSYQEAELGLCFARLVLALGYEVEIPNHVESGRAAISKGCLHQASRYAVRNVRLLSSRVTATTPLVGIEPSCILSFRDEYPRLVSASLREAAEQLAPHCLLYDEWLMREVKAGRISSADFHNLRPQTVYLHGHCHQKALVGVEKTADCLRLIPDTEVRIIPSGCCGMAGSFGYEKAHYEQSMEIGEMVLFPAVRQAAEENEKHIRQTVVCAPGTSCRQQIWDGTGIRALHPIEVLANAVLPYLKSRMNDNE